MSIRYPGGFITKSPPVPVQGTAKGVWTLVQALQLKEQGIWPPLVPGAPTIGAATATGSSTATVVFTAPVDNGGSAITLYTATSTPDSVTGTLSQAGSGTITVTGLTESTSYTFTVTATNAIGASAVSAASNSITTPIAPPGAIGSAYQGGFYAGDIGVSDVATHYLVVGPLSTGQTQLSWKNANTATPGANSLINGPQNTADMVADGNSTVYPCAHFCNNAVIGGFSDWYMPARNELEVCYFNLKPTTTANGTNAPGTNPNAVPARASNYTVGNPARTSAAAFQTGGAEPFVADLYWASNGVSATYAGNQTFLTGRQNYSSLYKNQSRRVRCIRRVPV